MGGALSDLLAASAPVGDTIGGRASAEAPLVVPPTPAHPLAVPAFNGQHDGFLSYDGGQTTVIQLPFVYLSVADAVGFWVRSDLCHPTSRREVSPSGTIIKDTYGPCRGGTEVVLYTIVEGGHTWPGGQPGTIVRDEPAQEISATHLVWKFFMKHPTAP